MALLRLAAAKILTSPARAGALQHSSRVKKTVNFPAMGVHLHWIQA
jgi:hypothetical protein